MGNSQLGFGFRTPPRKRERRRGRPAKHERVPHLPREVKARYPLHVTLRMLPHVWQLRSRRCYTVLEHAFYAGCDQFGTRIVHYSVQHNHIHLVAETGDARALARAIQGLAIRMAKGLNRVMDRGGRVFGDRYHARPLRTPTEVRKTLVYVYGNARKHEARFGTTFPPDWMDEYSSARWFEGWTVPLPRPDGRPPVADATIWLLTVGWQRAGGRLRRDEQPAGR